MRFIIAHATDARWEHGAIPEADLIDRVGQLIGRLSSAGIFERGEGLGPTSRGVRVRFRGHDREVVPGPFEGSHELPASLSILRTHTLDEAVAWAARQAAALGDIDVDIRPVNEPWDIGLLPKPDGCDTTRYMVVRKADSATEAGVAPTPDRRSALAHLIDETTRTGMHVLTETIAPSARGRRYLNTSNGISVYDGPFAESKELLGGFTIITADDLDAVDPWVRDYIAAVGAQQVDVLELATADQQ